MNTYEELLKNNPDLKTLTTIHFNTPGNREYTRIYAVEIYGNPADYLDVARKAKDLKCINLRPDQDAEFFKGLKKFVDQIDYDVKLCSNTIFDCTKDEFYNGEKIIESVISEMDPNWNAKQKLAFVHYKMGELVTYYPDYNSQAVPPASDSIPATRNIWKALSDGVSVCNGITEIERSILSRVGVETQNLSSGTHSFLLTKTDEGNIISDATWDLVFTKFKCRPQFLGLSYEQIRKKDGILSNAHKLKSIPENVISLSREEIVELYNSMGFLGNKKDFKTPVLQILSDLKNEYPDLNERISAAFTSLGNTFPNNMSSLSEVQQMMSYIVQWLGMNYNDFKTTYIYQSGDKKFEKTNLLFRLDGEDDQTFFKILDPETRAFRDITEKELVEQYRLHINSKEEPFWSNNHEKNHVESKRDKEIL